MSPLYFGSFISRKLLHSDICDVSLFCVFVCPEKEPAVDSCDMTSASISRDVQQWVMNSNNLEDIVEKVTFLVYFYSYDETQLSVQLDCGQNRTRAIRLVL